MFYKIKTIHNIVDNDGNTVVSIRKAHIVNINENINVNVPLDMSWHLYLSSSFFRSLDTFEEINIEPNSDLLDFIY